MYECTWKAYFGWLVGYEPYCEINTHFRLYLQRKVTLSDLCEWVQKKKPSNNVKKKLMSVTNLQKSDMETPGSWLPYPGIS